MGLPGGRLLPECWPRPAPGWAIPAGPTILQRVPDETTRLEIEHASRANRNDPGKNELNAQGKANPMAQVKIYPTSRVKISFNEQSCKIKTIRRPAVRNSSGAAPGWAANLPSFTIPTPAATAWSRVGCLGQLEYFIKRCHDGPWPAVLRVVFNQTVAGVKRGFPWAGQLFYSTLPRQWPACNLGLVFNGGDPPVVHSRGRQGTKALNERRGGLGHAKKAPQAGGGWKKDGRGRGTGKRKSKTLRHWGFPCDPSTQY